MDISNIALGLLNATRHEFGISNPMTEKVAQERYIICLGCPIISDNRLRCDKNKQGKVVKDFIYEGVPRTKGQIVTGCNCILGWKSRSNSQCPLGKW